MARLINNAKVYLEWDDGRRVEMGDLELEGHKSDAVMYWVPRSRWKVGLDLVRIGMRMMVTRHDCEVTISDEQGTERVD